MLMEKGGGGLSHLTPLERAIEYIETHLDENIDLGDVSREMGYSYYHMTRMFSAVLGTAKVDRDTATAVSMALTASFFELIFMIFCSFCGFSGEARGSQAGNGTRGLHRRAMATNHCLQAAPVAHCIQQKIQAASAWILIFAS